MYFGNWVITEDCKTDSLKATKLRDYGFNFSNSTNYAFSSKDMHSTLTTIRKCDTF